MNERILVIGDSWAAARESDTGLDRGWPFFMGVPSELRQGVSGSKAVDWAADTEGCLSRAIESSRGVDVVIVSLFGNDARHFADDGQITIIEVVNAIAAMHKVIASFSHVGRVVLLGYADPYFGKDIKSAIGVKVINSAVRLSTLGCQNSSMFDCSVCLSREHFDGVDFHSNESGHRVLASALGVYVAGLLVH